MKLQNVESIYSLSSLQQLMLLQSLSSKNGKGVPEHLMFTVKGELSENDLAQAWNHVTQRHAILRTAFYWQELSNPVQVVRNNVDSGFTSHDFRNEKALVEAAINLYVKQDLESGLQLDQVPLVRLAAFVLSDEEYTLFLSYHPIVLDGWSMVTVLKEFFSQLLIDDTTDIKNSNPPKFRDYIAWLRQRDSQNAKTWWQNYLQGFNSKTPLWISNGLFSTAKEQQRFTIERSWSNDEKEALTDFSRKKRTTLNVLIQTAWALLLGHYASKEDVVFGVAVSGRPPELTGVEDMVGTFINNVPIRVRTSQQASIDDILKDLTINMLDLKEHEHASPTQIQLWSELSSFDRLFETLVLFQNFPLEGTFWDGGRNFTICNVEKEIQTNFPLTLVCVPQPGFKLQLILDGRYWDVPLANKIMDDFISILQGMVKNEKADIYGLLLAIEKPDQGELSDFTPVQRPIKRQQNIEGPLTKTEETVARIWQDVLGFGPMNASDNFFDLGGRSLQVMAVHAKLCALGYDTFSLVELFEYPTVSQLAVRLSGSDDTQFNDDKAIRERAKKREGGATGRRQRMRKIRDDRR